MVQPMADWNRSCSDWSLLRSLSISPSNDSLFSAREDFFMLKREYNVHTAENGQEAVTVLDNEDIDLIVSDVMMPVMDGIEFCRYRCV